MNPIEAQLRSWTPRRPSRGLEGRLPGSEGPAYSVSRWITVLSPTAACVLLAALLVSQSAPDLLPSAGNTSTLAGTGLSNQNYAAYLPGTFQSAANRVDTFEWTNRGYSNSTMDSRTPPMATDL